MYQVEKTGENFRIIYDVKGRFTVHRITAQEAKYKLCKVREVSKSIYYLKYLIIALYWELILCSKK